MQRKVAVLTSITLSQRLLSQCLFNDDSSNSSDEDELELSYTQSREHYLTPNRIELYLEKVVLNYTLKEFQSHFRMNRGTYETLLRVLTPRLSKAKGVGRQTINVEKQILSTVWLLATPDSFRSVGERFNMGKSSLSVSFVRVVKALNEIAPDIINWPTESTFGHVKRTFYRMAGVDNIIGAIDGTFIPIKAPQKDPEVYVTRKCNYAMTLQGICDGELRFTDCYIGYPGSVSDTRIFGNSDIYNNATRYIERYFPNGTYVIGDKAYPVLEWCIPPYINRGNLTDAERHFNHVISQTRQTIERTFALLFGRFRRLKFLDMNRTDLIPATVIAACVLHNVCLDHSDTMLKEYELEGKDHVHHNDELEDVGNVIAQHGRQKRDKICSDMYMMQRRI